MLKGGSEHPDSLELVDFVVCRVSAEIARDIHHHALVCDRCASQIDALARLRCAVGLEVPADIRMAAATPALVQ